MKTKLLLVLITFTLFLIVPKGAKAESIYSTSSSYVVKIDSDQSMTVSHEMSLTNYSKGNVISAINYDIPFSATGLKAWLNNEPVSFKKKGDNVTLNFANRYIGVDETANFVFQYKISGFINDNGIVKSIYIPKFKVETDSRAYDLQVSYPTKWGLPSYVSSDDSQQVEKGERVYITMNTSKDILIDVGIFRSVEVNLNWELDDSVFDVKIRLPLPSAPNTQFAFGDLSYLANAEVDKTGSEYMVINTADGDTKQGSFAGIISNGPNRMTPQEGNHGFLKDTQQLGIGYTLSSDKIYYELLNAFEPDTKLGAGERRSIQALQTLDTKTSLDYATALTSLYREKGLNAEVVYGLVKFPFTDEFTWHYWVNFKEDTETTWKSADPYYEDLTSFYSFGKVNTERIAWGILGDDQDVKDLGINYFKDIDSSINLIRSESVLGINNGFELSLEPIGNSFSGSAVPFELKVKNNSNRSLKIEGIELAGREFDSNQIDNVLVLPGAETVVEISNVVMVNPLISGERLISGSAEVSIGDENFKRDITQEISFKIGIFSILLNALVIFVATTITFYYVRFLVVKHKQHGMGV